VTQRGILMALVRFRRSAAQITQIRKQLEIGEGDFLERRWF
jgi:hypothetical protein